MLGPISPLGTRDRGPGRWPLYAAAVLLSIPALWALYPAREPPGTVSPAFAAPPRPRSGYENRALWQGPASPVVATPAITGTVYDLQGRPVGGAVVTATTFHVAGNRPAAAGSVESDASGHFELPLPGGSYYLSGDKPGYGPARTIAHSGDDVGLVLVQSGVITGRVLDERGQPVRRFSVDVIGLTTDDMAAPAPFVSTYFDSPDGTYRIEQLPDQPVTLRATALEYAPSISDMVQVPPGETRAMDLTLSSGCTLRGMVEDTAGRPLQDVFVDAELRANAGVLGVASIDATSQADTDAQGHFVLEHVPLGDVLIRAYDGAHAVSTAAARIDQCDGLTPVTLRLSAGSTLEGSVLASSGAPVAGARVTLTGRALGFVSTVSDAEGRYRFQKLPAGPMRIEAARGAQRAVTIVAVPENGATEKDLPFPAEGTGEIRGRVTARGVPLPGMSLMVVTHQGQGMLDTMYSTTALDGGYRVPGLAAGMYAILVMSTSSVGSARLLADAVETVNIDVGVKPEVAPLPDLPDDPEERLRVLREHFGAGEEPEAPRDEADAEEQP